MGTLSLSSFAHRKSKLHTSKKRRNFRRLVLETLSSRQLLAADLAGDDLPSAQELVLQPETLISLEATIGDGLHGNKDVDLYAVDLAEGQTISVDVDAYWDDQGNTISALDSFVRFFDASGISTADEYEDDYREGYGHSDNDYGYEWDQYNDDYREFTAQSTGTYYIGISADGNRSYSPLSSGSGYGASYSGYTGDYRVQIQADTPPMPTLSVSDVSISEGNGSVSFDVTLSMSSSETITVDYATADDTAIASEDYALSSGALTFQPGELSKTVVVPILDDSLMEDDESFTITLTNAVGAPIDSEIGTATIQDDDPDLAGDSVSSAHVLSLVPNVLLEIDATIGDGLHGNKDVDLYAVELGEGQTIAVDVDAYLDDQGNSISNLDSFVRFFDADGYSTAGEYEDEYREGFGYSANDYDDEWGQYSDDYREFTAPSSGTYYIGISADANRYYTALVGGSGYGTNYHGYLGDYRIQLTSDAPPVPTLSVNGGTFDEDASTATFDISLSMTPTESITVNYATSDETATAGSDYSATAGTITFAPGETSKTVTVDIFDDDDMEANESFKLTLTDAVNAPIDTESASAIIRDNDPDLSGDSVDGAQTITVEPSVLMELNASIGDGVYGNKDVDLYAVELAEGQTISVDIDAYWDDSGNTISSLDSFIRFFDANGISTADEYEDDYRDGFAHAPNDYGYQWDQYSDDYREYTATSTGTYYIGISSNSNRYYNPLSAGSGYGGNGSSATGDYVMQITADAPPVPTLSIGDATVDESAGTATIDVSLSMAGLEPITVDFGTSDGTAQNGDDFMESTGTLVFAPGEVSKTIDIPIVDDDLMESNESLDVTLSNAVGAPIEIATGSVTITNDDADSAGDDLTSAKSIVPTFSAPIVLTATIGDGLFGNEDVDLYEVELSQGQTIAVDIDAYWDDDGNAVSSLDSFIRFFDGDGYSTTDEYEDDYREGYGHAPNDYGNQWEQYSDDYREFTATTSGTYYIGISASANRNYDPLTGGSGYGSNYSGYTGDYILQVTTDGAPMPSFSVEGTTIRENEGTAEFTVTLAGETDESVSVQYSTTMLADSFDGAVAEVETDFVGVDGTLNFLPGETTKTVSVAIVDDDVMESHESFALTLSNAVGALINGEQAIIQIENDDADAAGDNVESAQIVNLEPETPWHVDAMIGDGSEGLADVDFYAIELQEGQSVSIDIDTINEVTGESFSSLDSLIRVFDSLGRDALASEGLRSGDASSNPDEVGNNGDDFLLFVAPTGGQYFIGVSSQHNRTYTSLAAGSATDGEDADQTGAYQLSLTAHAPPLPTMTIEDVAVDSRQNEAVFAVQLSKVSNEDITVDYVTNGITATEDEDFTSTTGTITIPAGLDRALIAIPIIDDGWVEEDETFELVLSEANGATLVSAIAMGTILGQASEISGSTIGFDSFGVPHVTLDRGLRISESTVLLDTDIEILADTSIGTFTEDESGAWTYTESFVMPAPVDQAESDQTENDDENAPLLSDLGPFTDHGYDESLSYTFTASGDASGSEFTLDVDGSRQESDEESGDFDNQSLDYTLTAQADSDGQILSATTSGDATHQYLYSYTTTWEPGSPQDDSPTSDETSSSDETSTSDTNSEEENSDLSAPDTDSSETTSDGDDSAESPSTDTETSDDLNFVTATESGSFSLSFLPNGFTIASTDTASLSFNITEPFSESGTVPAEALEDVDLDESDSQDTATSDDPSDEDDENTFTTSGSITSTGSNSITTTLNSSYDLSATLVSMNLTTAWNDGGSFSYTSTGTYDVDGVTGTITESSSDSFSSIGSMSTTYDTATGWSNSGASTDTVSGNASFSNTWSSPYTVDSGGMDLTGSLSGSTTSSSNYSDTIEVELRLHTPVDGDESEDDGEESTEPYFRWELVGGSFSDYATVTDTLNYSASGTYSAEHGIIGSLDGSTSSMGATVTGTVTTSGGMSSTFWTDIAGEYTSEGDVDLTKFEIGSDESENDSFSLTASGTILPSETGGWTGTITISDISSSSFSQRLVHNLAGDVQGTEGHLTHTSSIVSSYDQVANADYTVGELTGSQYSNVNESLSHSSTVILNWDDSVDTGTDTTNESADSSADSQSTDSQSTDSQTTDSQSTGGWVDELIDITSSSSGTSSFGYDVSGTITVGNLSGTKNLNASHSTSASTYLRVFAENGADPTSTFVATNSQTDTDGGSHNLTGSFTDTVDPPGVEVTGTEHDIASNSDTITSYSKIEIIDDSDPVITAHTITDTASSTDVGRLGTSAYTRVDGDATWTGTATINESNTTSVSSYLYLSLTDAGDWIIGSSDPLANVRASKTTITVDSSFGHSFNGTAVIAGSDSDTINWTGTGTESGNSSHSSTMTTTSIPSIDGSLSTSTSTTTSDSDNQSESSSDSSQQSGEDNEDTDGDVARETNASDEDTESLLPSLQWTTTGTASNTINFARGFGRIATGIYTDGDMTGTATQSIAVSSAFNRSTASSLSDDQWEMTSGSGDSLWSSSTAFGLNASGPVTMGHLTGTSTLGNSNNASVVENRTDTYNVATQKWDSTGTRTIDNSGSDSSDVNVSGTETTYAGGFQLSALRKVDSGSSASYTYYTEEELKLVPPDPNATSNAETSADSENEYEWEVTLGNKTSDTTSGSGTSLVGSGTHTQEINAPYSGTAVSLTYTLNRNDSNSSANETHLKYVYDTTSEDWSGGGWSRVSTDVANGNSANGAGTYSFGIVTGDGEGSTSIASGIGNATHSTGSSNSMSFEDTVKIGEPPANMPLPDLVGTFTATDSAADSVGSNGGTSFTVDAGGATEASGNVNFDVGSFSTGTMTISMNRDAGQTDWTKDGSMSDSSGSHDNFSSSVSGDWGSPASGGFGQISGSFNKSIVDDQTNTTTSSGPLNDDGGFDITTVLVNNFDKQNISTHNGFGTYEVTEHGVLISGTVTISKDNQTISDQQLTSTISPDGSRSDLGQGKNLWVNTSSFGANGAGTLSESTTVNTPVDGTLSVTTTLDHSISHGTTRVHDSRTEELFGIVDKDYALKSTDTSLTLQNDTNSTVDLKTVIEGESDYSFDNGHTAEPTDLSSSTYSEQHVVSTRVNTDQLTTTHFQDHIQDTETATRSGSASTHLSRESDTINHGYASRLNNIVGGSNWQLIGEIFEDWDESGHGEALIVGSRSYGATPADDTGSTTFTASGYGNSYWYTTWDDMVVLDIDMSWNDDPVTITETVNDDEPSGETIPNITHDSSSPPSLQAAPSVSAFGKPMEASLVDEALGGLMGYMTGGFFGLYDALTDDSPASMVSNAQNQRPESVSDAISMVNENESMANDVTEEETSGRIASFPRMSTSGSQSDFDQRMRDAIANESGGATLLDGLGFDPQVMAIQDAIQAAEENAQARQNLRDLLNSDNITGTVPLGPDPIRNPTWAAVQDAFAEYFMGGYGRGFVNSDGTVTPILDGVVPGPSGGSGAIRGSVRTGRGLLGWSAAPNSAANPWGLIDRFRRGKHGLDELGDTIPIRGDGLGTVSFVEVNGRRVFGVNSTALVRDVDKNLARAWRTRLGFNQGQAQALFHAEAHSLMRAYQKTGGKLPRELTLHVDRLTCGPCQGALPDLIREMGIERLIIRTKSGRIGEIVGDTFRWLE